jgi:hypothetical protein
VDSDADRQPILASLAPTQLCPLPVLPPELDHATAIPALQTEPLLGQNLVIENIERDPVGLCFERYRSLLKAFIISTDLAYETDFTEQSGTEIWQKLYPGARIQRPRRRRQPHPHHLTDLTRGYHRLEQTDLLVLCLQPRNERQFKTAQQAFVRERIDYARVFNSLLEARLCHGRPTWVFTPHRLDDPEFVAVYGESFARLIATNLTPLRFGQPAPDRAVPRRNLAPSEIRWHDQSPAAIFVDPTTGAISIPDKTRLPPPLPSRAPLPTLLSQPKSAPSPTQSAEPASPYAAEMARYSTRTRFAARTSKATGEIPPGVPAPPSQTPGTPAPPSQNRRARLVYGDQSALNCNEPAPARRTFYLDHSRLSPDLDDRSDNIDP